MIIPREVAYRIAQSAIEGASGQAIVERAGVITDEERLDVLGVYDALLDRADEVEGLVLDIIERAKPAEDHGWPR